MKERGIIALISVLIISAAVILVSIGTNLLGISQSQIGFKRQDFQRALYGSGGCGEEALLKLRDNFSGYAGNEVISVDGVTCTIRPVLSAGADKIIEAESVVANHPQRMKITVSRPSLKLIISSWEEIADF